LESGYPNPQTPFQNQSLDAKSVNKAKELLKAFPKELLGVNGEIIGCPNCADEGALYVEIKLKGQETRYWLIGKSPEYMWDFLEKMMILVEELKEK
jgi:hypothetical protein